MATRVYHLLVTHDSMLRRQTAGSFSVCFSGPTDCKNYQCYPTFFWEPTHQLYLTVSSFLYQGPFFIVHYNNFSNINVFLESGCVIGTIQLQEIIPEEKCKYIYLFIYLSICV